MLLLVILVADHACFDDWNRAWWCQSQIDKMCFVNWKARQITVFVHAEIYTVILARLIENHWMVPFALSPHLLQIIMSR
jgi:hypothetical protein